MDLNIILFNIFFLIVFILPFILLGLFQQKKRKKLQNLITALAATHQCTLTDKEFCGELVIGLDTKMKYLFFVKRLGMKNNQEVLHAIDLQKMRRCKIVKQLTAQDHAQRKQEVIEKLELAFFDGIAALPTVCIEFFNSANSLQLTGEYALLEKWEKKLNMVFSQTIHV